MSPDLGCYDKSIKGFETPNLDAFSTQGTRFTHVFGTSGVCSANRSAFNTGMYQTSIGAHNHRTSIKQPLPEGLRTIPDYFRQAGYFVCNGKPEDHPELPITNPGKVDWNFLVEGKAFDGTDWSQRELGQPFFAQINIDESHRPWTRDMENPVNPAEIEIPPYYPDHPLFRIDWALYLEEIQVFDRKVGAILKRLEKEGLANNTIVFVFGDNGRPFCRDKGYIYDGGLRVPLIIRWPDGRNENTVDDRLISMIDLGPTAMQMAGIEIPEHMQGRPIYGSASTDRTVVFAAKDRIGSVPDRVRGLRTKDFKYLRNFRPEIPYLPINRYSLLTHPSLSALLMLHQRGELDPKLTPLVLDKRPEEELYDLLNDPFELNNLAGNPKYKNTLLEFRHRINDWVTQTGDQGVQFESQELIQAYLEWLNPYLEKQLKPMGIALNDLNPETMFKYWMYKYDLRE